MLEIGRSTIALPVTFEKLYKVVKVWHRGKNFSSLIRCPGVPVWPNRQVQQDVFSLQNSTKMCFFLTGILPVTRPLGAVCYMKKGSIYNLFWSFSYWFRSLRFWWNFFGIENVYFFILPIDGTPQDLLGAPVLGPLSMVLYLPPKLTGLGESVWTLEED